MENYKKSTLVIDGNYFIYSRLYVLPRPKQIAGLPEEKFMSTDKDKGMFMRKLALDFASEMRKMKFIVNRIVFTVDHRSWRKDFYPESGYKSNRTLDEKIDWKGISEVIDDFLKIIQKQGVIVNKMPGAEGDDLIFAWSMYLNSNGENSIILTGDQDLIQLVNYNNSTGTYTLWYDNTRAKLVTYPGFNKWLHSSESSKNNIDIFSKDTGFYLVDQIKKEFRELITKNKLTETEVFCDDFALEKILTGDKSDNIKSVIEKPSSKGDKFFKFSPKKAKNVINTFKKRHSRFSTLYLFEEEYKKEIVQLVSREMKVVGKNDEILSNLEMNTTLVLLHVNTIPDAIQKSMFEQISSDTISESPLQIITLSDRDKLLNNTKYLDPNYNKALPKGGVGGLF